MRTPLNAIFLQATLSGLALLFSCELSAQQNSERNILELLELANSEYTAESFESAKTHYDAFVAVNPIHNDALSRLFKVNLRLSLWEDAIASGLALDKIGHGLGASFAYEMAKAYTQVGNKVETFAWLKKALDEKYENRTGLYTDPVFYELRDDPEFIALTAYTSPDLDRVSGWRADLAFFQQEAVRLHEHPNKPSSSSAFQSAVNNLYTRIPQLADQDILMEFNKLMAMLDDGHSVIYGPSSEARGNYINSTLPLKFYDFEDGLFIIDATDGYQDLVGSRVLWMGDITPAQAFDKLLNYRGVDNPMTIRWLGAEFYLRDLGFLQALGASPDGQSLTLKTEAPGGEMKEVLVNGDGIELPRKLRPPKASSANTPTYLQRVDENYWYKPIPEIHSIYFQFNQVRDKGRDDTLAAFSDALLDSLLADSIKNLIIDVRHNNGGNNRLLTQLVNNLVVFDNEPDTQIYIITSRGTFSAAQNFINRVELLTDAIFVGEPSSSRPNFVGEGTDVVFPWSRIGASISTRYWQDSSPTDARKWIAPDLPIGLSSYQYFNNIDPTLERITSVLKKQEQ